MTAAVCQLCFPNTQRIWVNDTMVIVYTLIVAVIIILAALENLWPSLIGFMTTPQGFVFLGTIHHPGDYFYYLSQFAQGSERIITTVDLYTGEPIAPSFIGWSNVFMGKLLHALGIMPVAAYQVSVIIFTLAALTSALLLCKAILQKPWPTLTAFYLFCIFHAFPVIRDGASSYGDYWNNYAVPRVRLGGVPHQLLLTAASFLMVYFALNGLHKNPRRLALGGLALTSLVLASLQPVLWALIAGSLLLALLSYQGINIKKILSAIKNALPVLITLLISGLPPVVYLTRLFSMPPFSQLKSWEAAQQTALIPEHFLTATGPVFLVALFAIPFILYQRKVTANFIIIFTVLSLMFFLSPIPQLIGITHVRFMATLTILGLSVIAAYGITPLFTSRSRWAKVAGVMLMATLSAIMLPNHIKTVRLTSVFTPNNTYQYIRESDYTLLMKAKDVSRPGEVFLVTPWLDTQFPGLTGRSVFYGHPLLTINAEAKMIQRDIFFSTATPDAMKAFTRTHGISWLVTDTSWEKLNSEPWIKQIQRSNNLILYQVQKWPL